MIGKLISAGVVLLSMICCLTYANHAAALTTTCDALFATKDASQNENDAYVYHPRISTDAKTGQQREERFAQARNGRELFVDYLRPAAGKPTLVLVNGLTYRTGVWDRFVEKIKGQGLGILRYDPMGMGKTMEKHGPLKRPVSMTEQVQDLNALLTNLGIHDKVHLLGLSYGGGLAIQFAATYPDRVETLIPMAAYTAPLASQVQQIQAKISWTRLWYPTNKATDEELYAFFLKQIVYSSYPLSEPIFLEHPWKLESVYNLALGATPYNAENFIGALPAGVLYQIDARQDQYIPPSVPQNFWDKIPAKVRASRIIVDRAEHKIPEQLPEFSALIVKKIISGDPRLHEGRTWAASNLSDTLRDETDRIDLKK